MGNKKERPSGYDGVTLWVGKDGTISEYYLYITMRWKLAAFAFRILGGLNQICIEDEIKKGSCNKRLFRNKVTLL